MKDGRRVQRVEKEIQHIVANFLVRGFKTPLSGFVSVSRVESTEKLRTAKVYISVLGSDAQKDETIEILNDHIREIQNEVNRGLRMKFVPRLSIVLDTGLERLLKVETALRDIALSQKSTTEE